MFNLPLNLMQMLMQNCNGGQQVQSLQQRINSVQQMMSQPNFNPQQFLQQKVNSGELTQERLNYAMGMANKFTGRG